MRSENRNLFEIISDGAKSQSSESMLYLYVKLFSKNPVGSERRIMSDAILDVIKRYGMEEDL